MSSEGTVVEWGGQPWVVSNHMIRVLGYDGDTYALLLVGLDGSFDWVDKRRVDELPRMSIIGPEEASVLEPSAHIPDVGLFVDIAGEMCEATGKAPNSRELYGYTAFDGRMTRLSDKPLEEASDNGE